MTSKFSHVSIFQPSIHLTETLVCQKSFSQEVIDFLPPVMTSFYLEPEPSCFDVETFRENVRPGSGLCETVALDDLEETLANARRQCLVEADVQRKKNKKRKRRGPQKRSAKEGFTSALAKGGAVLAAVKTVPVVDSTPDDGEDENECSICFELIPSSRSAARRALPCSHKFHTICLASWIASGGDSCPMCRANFS
jgi:hypothetical protein